MWSRRRWLSAFAPAPLGPCPASARALAFPDIPASAHRIAADLELTAPSWPAYLTHQKSSLSERLTEGSAEHLTYYFLQSRRFTVLPVLSPLLLAKSDPAILPSSVQARIEAFAASADSTLDPRHELLVSLYRQLPPAWDLPRCFRHTMQFLRARAAPRPDLDSLYQQRGLSSDSEIANTETLRAAWPKIVPVPRSVLLVGPGLDLTRREDFDDARPLAQPQFNALAQLLPRDAAIHCADVRPEVLTFLAKSNHCAINADITASVPGEGAYDLAIATNLLVYFDDRALFCAMAAIAAALRPGGYLLHNDMRFAAKVFGGVLGLPAIHFAPVSLGRRGAVEQLDRVVLHRRRLHPA